MKNIAHRVRSFRLALAAALLAGSAGALAEVGKAVDRVQVTWAPTEQLAEVKNNQFNRGWLRPNEWEEQLSNQLRKSADKVLAPGEQLQVHVNDVSLAGAFEPWHRTATQDIRYLKDIYPPWMSLHYTLLGADGKVIREADAKLRDGAYLQREPPGYTTDPLRYDKRMIDEWVRDEFGAQR